MLYQDFSPRIQARLDVVDREQDTICKSAYVRYNAVMNTAEGQATYRKAIQYDLTEDAYFANMLLDAALALCSLSSCWNKRAAFARTWTLDELTFLELFCSPEFPVDPLWS